MTSPAPALSLAPQALLFDMDGVLADVSASYRQAVIETARAFGVTIDRGQVSAAKARGNANNDWELSTRLINQAGVEAAFEDVKATFERLYQGTGSEPGFYRRETLLTSTALLERLAARLPLGIVTGRPRADAQRFAEDHAIASYFRVMVCLEDAPPKPDPAPVRLLMKRLEVDNAWLIGDTPDDMQAAVQADVPALGLIAPGDDPQLHRVALERAGAAHVLSDLEELEGLLP